MERHFRLDFEPKRLTLEACIGEALAGMMMGPIGNLHPQLTETSDVHLQIIVRSHMDIALSTWVHAFVNAFCAYFEIARQRIVKIEASQAEACLTGEDEVIDFTCEVHDA